MALIRHPRPQEDDDSGRKFTIEQTLVEDAAHLPVIQHHGSRNAGRDLQESK